MSSFALALLGRGRDVDDEHAAVELARTKWPSCLSRFMMIATLTLTSSAIRIRSGRPGVRVGDGEARGEKGT